MALFEVSFRAPSLGMNTNMYVLLPTDALPVPDGGYPVVYLLHGLSDDHTKWLRSTRIEDYAAGYGACVVMPEAQCSFYVNMKNGLNYYDFIVKDLPGFIQKTFPVSGKRESTFIAGLSMGGFGALNAGLRAPEKYAACAALSPATKPFSNVSPGDVPRMRIASSIMGEDFILSDEHDLFSAADEFSKLPPEKRARIYMAVGREDFLYGGVLDFKSHLEASGVEFSFEEGPGSHNWDFWDEYVKHALKFFFRGHI